MNKSEQIDKLAAALSRAQGSLMGAKKNCINPFHKSKYADLSSVIQAASPALQENELSIVQLTEINDGNPVLRTTLMHSSGQYISGVNPLYMPKGDMQSMGSAITYARRYAYSAMIGVVSDVDDDGESIKNTYENQTLKFTNKASKKKTQIEQPAFNDADRHQLATLPSQYIDFVLNKKKAPSPEKLSNEEVDGALKYFPTWEKKQLQEVASA